MRFTGIPCLHALVLLVACGGTTTEPPPPEPDTIAFELFADGQDIASDIARQNAALGPMDPLDLPAAGSADYQGTAEISSTAGLNAIGVLSMEIVFDTGFEAVTGSATDFIGTDDTPVDGTLSITDGSFDRNGGAGADLTAIVSGTFDGGTFVITGSQLTGDLHGAADGATLDGTVSGTVSSQPTTFNVTLNAEVED